MTRSSPQPQAYSLAKCHPSSRGQRQMQRRGSRSVLLLGQPVTKNARGKIKQRFDQTLPAFPWLPQTLPVVLRLVAARKRLVQEEGEALLGYPPLPRLPPPLGCCCLLPPLPSLAFPSPHHPNQLACLLPSLGFPSPRNLNHFGCQGRAAGQNSRVQGCRWTCLSEATVVALALEAGSGKRKGPAETQRCGSWSW